MKRYKWSIVWALATWVVLGMTQGVEAQQLCTSMPTPSGISPANGVTITLPWDFTFNSKIQFQQSQYPDCSWDFAQMQSATDEFFSNSSLVVERPFNLQQQIVESYTLNAGELSTGSYWWRVRIIHRRTSGGPTETYSDWSAPRQFIVMPTPQLASLSPSSGPAGTSVTINGSGFIFLIFSFSEVLFDNNPIGQQNTTLISDTQIAFDVPPGASCGDHDVSVRNPGGFQSNKLTFSVTCSNPNPVANLQITGLSPSTGGPGDTVTISGSGFIGGVFSIAFSSVFFDGQAVPTTYIDATTLSFVVPNQNFVCGPYDVQVENVDPAALPQFSNTTSFDVSCSGGNPTIPTPQITGLSPNTGGPGDTVTVSGSGFIRGGLATTFSSVLFDGQAVSTTYVDTHTLRFDVPNQNLTCVSHDVQVVNDDPLSFILSPPTSNTVGFTVSCNNSGNQTPTPQITGLSPNNGGPGDTVTLNGSGFIGGGLAAAFSSVLFNGQAVPTTFIDANTLKFDVPGPNLQCGRYDVQVENSDPTILFPPLSNTVSFDVPCQAAGIPTPHISSLSPATGKSGDTITVHGSQFFAGTLGLPASDPTVVFDKQELPATYVNSTTLKFVVPRPNMQCGTYDVRVVNSAGPLWGPPPYPTSNTVSFSVPCSAGGKQVAAPKILGLTPSSGVKGVKVKVQGSHFVPAPGSKVLFDGTALNATFTSPQDLTFNVPNNASCGAHQVQVSTANPATQTSNAVTFTVTSGCTNSGPQNRPPVAKFSYAPTKVVANKSVTFSNQSSDPDGNADIATTVWDFGDGTQHTAKNPSHVFSKAGTYTVVLSISDKAGHSVSASQTIQVSASSNGSVALSIDQAVARLVPNDPAQQNADALVGDREIIMAVQYWILTSAVPHTNGKMISDAKILDLIKKWVMETTVSQSTAGVSNAVALQHLQQLVKQVKTGQLDLSATPLTLHAVYLHPLSANRWSLETRGQGITHLRVQVFDTAGRLMMDEQTQGQQLQFNSVDRDGQRLANGVYFYLVTVYDADDTPLRGKLQKWVMLR